MKYDDIAVQAFIRDTLYRINNLNNSILVFGAELEFYYTGNRDTLNDTLLQYLNNEIIDRIDDEDGNDQFECVFAPINDPLLLCDWISMIKHSLSDIGANFKAVPFNDMPGSGLHIHISIYDKDGNNMLIKEDRSYTERMHHIVGGLLSHVLSSMLIFAPEDNSYIRLSRQHGLMIHKHYPYNCSWGLNNRTCAIRIPRVDNLGDTRIEHRVPCSDADHYLTMAVILFAIEDGLINSIPSPKPIFGDAFHEHYHDIVRLPATQEDAIKYYIGSKLSNIDLFNDILKFHLG